MAKTGKTTATSASNLFSQIVSWLTAGADAGRDWTIVKDYRTDAEPLERVVIHNTGLSGQDDVYIGLSNEIYSDTVRAGMCCRVYRYFDPEIQGFFDTAFGSRKGYGDTWAFMPYWNNQVDYWIWSNKQRIIIIVKTNDMYANAYLGMFDRFISKSEYQYPLACITDSVWESNWGTYIGHNELWSSRDSLDGFDNSSTQRLNFIRVMPELSTSSNWDQYKVPACKCINRPSNTWAYRWRIAPTRMSVSGWNLVDNSETIDGYGERQIIYPDNAPVVVFPTYIYCYDLEGYKAVLGQLDGVYYCPSAFNSPESVVGNEYIVFPDINRTNWYSWMAIKDE